MASQGGGDYTVEPLHKQHDRKAFACGVELLDRYLHRQAGQDARKRIAASFVLVEKQSGRVAGYYTLSAMGIDAGELPIEITRELPRYPIIPATLLGRLAVDRQLQGRGLGEMLLMDALRRSCRMSRQIASAAVVVDAIDDRAEAFYRGYGFRPFPRQERRLFVAMSVVEKLIS